MTHEDLGKQLLNRFKTKVELTVDHAALGDYVRNLRNQSKTTLVAAAKASSMTPQHISDVERGRRGISAAALGRLIAAITPK